MTLVGDAVVNDPDIPVAERFSERERLIAAVDGEVAATLASKKGAWSRTRLRDMVDRIVFRHDPDSVRERRRRALEERGVWTESNEDGTAEIAAKMSAENVRIAVAAVRGLADAVCGQDGRTRQQAASDAMFALLTGSVFECQCGDDTCTAHIPDSASGAGAGVVASVNTKVVIHVVCDEATLDGESANVGWVDKHGVISDEHVRDLAARPDAVIKPLVPAGTPQNPDGTFTLPTTQPSDPYRPSTVLDEFVAVRDGYCVDPGCDQSAFDEDRDHVDEYDHENPSAGGQTTADNLNSKCRGDHLLKTHGDWVDDQYRDQQGRLHTIYTTPEGVTIEGDAETMEDFFAGLRRIRFAPPGTNSRNPNSKPEPAPENPRRRRTRTADKHARRRAERRRNRQKRERRERAASIDDPPPF